MLDALPPYSLRTNLTVSQPSSFATSLAVFWMLQSQLFLSVFVIRLTPHNLSERIRLFASPPLSTYAHNAGLRYCHSGCRRTEWCLYATEHNQYNEKPKSTINFKSWSLKPGIMRNFQSAVNKKDSRGSPFPTCKIIRFSC